VNELTELASADAYCRRLTNRHYENFSVISVFLPTEVRRDLTRIYAFCRTTDDFGDESQGDGMDRLTRWREEVGSCFDGAAQPIHPVLLALKVTVRTRGITRGPFMDLIEANVQDQTVSRYESWDDLRAYCMLSAAPVGRMVLTVFGVDDERARALSDDVCIGLQLANHAQDVKRDAARGRCYLPQAIIREGGVPAGVRDLTDRAEALLGSGSELERMVPIRLRAQLALYRLGGMEIVSAIRDVTYRTDLTRPIVPTPRKIALLARGIVQSVQ
jgi:squalene synthase HpnC